MIGVPNMEPKTPPLLMVKVPPSMSSMASVPARACRHREREQAFRLILLVMFNAMLFYKLWALEASTSGLLSIYSDDEINNLM